MISADFWRGFLFFAMECTLLSVGLFFLLRHPVEPARSRWLLSAGFFLVAAKQLFGALGLFLFFRIASPGSFAAGAGCGLVGVCVGILVWSRGFVFVQTAESSSCVRRLRLTRRSSRLQRNMGAKPELQHMQVVK